MALIFEGRPHDLGGGMLVQRILPYAKKRMLGPFAFLDHMGPFEAIPGQNTDVRPHPHIGLSTLTYLFDGRIVHHDSLGSTATILPGEVNWMTAGKGIAHSERTHPEDRNKKRRLHGLQFWIALPDGKEEVDPDFHHYERQQIPRLETVDYNMSLIAGEGFGLKSAVKISSPLIFAEFLMKRQKDINVALASSFEIGVYVIEGSVKVNGEEVPKHYMAACDVGQAFTVSAPEGSHFVILGGEPFKTPRHVWWNLVSSSKDRIELVKQQWKDKTFPQVPGETEFIPLPEV